MDEVDEQFYGGRVRKSLALVDDKGPQVDQQTHTVENLTDVMLFARVSTVQWRFQLNDDHTVYTQ